MGLSGPAPKDESQRRRTNAPTVAWVELPAEGRSGPVPKLPPKSPGDRNWLKQTREWWARLWTKPQATQWDDDDASMFRLAALYDLFWRGEATAANQSEMRQIEDAHGLSPKSMLALRWRLASTDPEERATAPAKTTRRKVDPKRRAALKLVEGDA